MFERNRIENASSKRDKTVPVELSLDDGRILKGKFFLSSTRNLYEELNGAGSFLEFAPYDGQRELIAKSVLRSVRLTDVPRPVDLSARSGQENFDPYDILGIPPGAAWEKVREAYHRLSKFYHPDRYAGVELPEEVRAYLDTMSRRLNAAFAALEKPHQIKREINRAKTEPIYQRG